MKLDVYSDASLRRGDKKGNTKGFGIVYRNKDREIIIFGQLGKNYSSSNITQLEFASLHLCLKNLKSVLTSTFKVSRNDCTEINLYLDSLTVLQYLLFNHPKNKLMNEPLNNVTFGSTTTNMLKRTKKLKKKFIQEYEQIFDLVQNELTIITNVYPNIVFKFDWVKSHNCTDGNVLADFAARAATR